MIIDIHTHTFPDAIAYKTIAGMEEDIVRGQGIHVKSARIPTVKGLEDSTKKADIDLSVVCPVATNIRQPEKINRLSVELNEKREETRLFNFGAIHPDCENYKQIIDEYSNAAPAAFLAGVHHNMGVALARMFLYNEASYSFMKAYEIGQHKNSYKCYLAAKWFMDKDGSVINEDVPEEEYIIRRKIEQLMDNAAYQDEIRKLNDTEKYKNAGDVAGYHKVLDDILTNWKQDYYKYTAR